MKDSDYEIFLIQAISRPLVSSKFNYYFDRNNYRLICILINKSKFIDTNWIELPRLSTESKKDFIKKFADKEKAEIKNYILKIIENFNDSSAFNIENELKKTSFDTAFRYSFKKLDFLWNSIDKLYKEYNLNAKIEIIWDINNNDPIL